jgi:hypothetical protein
MQVTPIQWDHFRLTGVSTRSRLTEHLDEHCRYRNGHNRC